MNRTTVTKNWGVIPRGTLLLAGRYTFLIRGIHAKIATTTKSAHGLNALVNVVKNEHENKQKVHGKSTKLDANSHLLLPKTSPSLASVTHPLLLHLLLLWILFRMFHWGRFLHLLRKCWVSPKDLCSACFPFHICTRFFSNHSKL